MPTIAQKLCNDIVEPILAPSSSEIVRHVPPGKLFKSMNGNSSLRFAKPTKSLVVEKKKIISQLEPSSKTVIDQIKSKDTIVKKNFIDAAVNTLVSGPLRCDNDCVTNVRKRERHCSCKHFQKKNNLKTSAKQVQTLMKSCSQLDKACTQSIDTTNCSTQFVDSHNSKLRTQISNRLLLKRSNELDLSFSYQNAPQSSSRISRTMCQNAKRWALSNYPSKGPDF